MSQSTTKGIPIDTDITLSSNSDAVVSSQKAVKAYVDVQLKANLKTTMAGNTTSNIVYLSAKAVYDWATNLFELITNKQNSLAVDGTGTKFVTVDAINANTQTKQVVTLTTSSAPTINVTGFRKTFVSITAQSGAINLSTNLTGTKEIGDVIIFQIKDNGTSVAITCGSLFQPLGNSLPTTTIASKYLTFGSTWNGTKYGVLAVDYEQ